MKTIRKEVLLVVCILTSLSAMPGVHAGLLDPTGPPAQTMKTLHEVEPRIAINDENTPGDANSLYIISEPGSYYLTGNITINFKHAILITSSDVTLDLMGYRIYSSYLFIPPGGGTIDFDAIHLSAESKNIKISNGSVVSNRQPSGMMYYKGFRYGIYSDDSSAQDISIAEMRIVGSRMDGIHLEGANIHVQSCDINSSTLSGIYIGDDSTVSNCKIHDNGNAVSTTVYGVYTGNGSTVSNCKIYNNCCLATAQVYAVKGGSGCIIRDNVLYGNLDSASAPEDVIYCVRSGSGSMIIGNTAYDNADSATAKGLFIIFGYNSSTVSNNTAYANAASANIEMALHIIHADLYSTMEDNTASENGLWSTAQFFYVIAAGQGGTVTGNSASHNGIQVLEAEYPGTLVGIILPGHNLVDQNTAYDNNGINMNALGGCVFGNNVAP